MGGVLNEPIGPNSDALLAGHLPSFAEGERTVSPPGLGGSRADSYQPFGKFKTGEAASDGTRVNPFESKVRGRLVEAGLISRTDDVEAIPAWSFGANYEAAVLWRVMPAGLAAGLGVAFADALNVRNPALAIGALTGAAAVVGGIIGDRRRKVRDSSMPSAPSRRSFGVALSGKRLFVVAGDERGRMTGDAREFVEAPRRLDVTQVKRFGLVTARRYRIDFLGGEELNLEVQATKSAQQFFDRVADLVSSTTG